jgi:hypothetical protein
MDTLRGFQASPIEDGSETQPGDPAKPKPVAVSKAVRLGFGGAEVFFKSVMAGVGSPIRSEWTKSTGACRYRL